MQHPPSLCVIYAITDPGLLPEDALISGVQRALEAGITTIQYRDKLATESEKHRRATQLVALCNAFNAALIINDSVALAAAVGAHGVHLGQSDGAVDQARQALGPQAIIGATCHNDLNLAQQAQTEGASYVAFGRFFSSTTKPLAKPATVAVLQQAQKALHIPVVAIGGITPANLTPLLQAGATSVAVCHSLFGQAAITEAAQSLLSAARVR